MLSAWRQQVTGREIISKVRKRIKPTVVGAPHHGGVSDVCYLSREKQNTIIATIDGVAATATDGKIRIGDTNT